MLAAPLSSDNAESALSDTATNPAAVAVTTVGTNARPAHNRSSGARRNTPAMQTQISSATNGNTSGNAMSTPVLSKQPHTQPPGIAAGTSGPQFEGSRSPPGSKNLNHVPCKFFRQGACQAGKACPFSHNMDPTIETAPCKYFSKGNCKFGAKCALAHILPDGRRVNRPAIHGNGHLQFGRMDTGFTNHRSALHNSLMQANTSAIGHHTPTHSLGGQEDFPALTSQPTPQIEQNLSSSIPDSQFGSPRNAEGLSMSVLGSSHRTLGPLDATLPASIDRYDYSYYAKHGPFASSVPNTFGVESPPPSLPSSIRGETTVSALRRSAFGEEDSTELSRSAQLREGSFGERILHSSTRRNNKIYSSSYAGPQTLFNGFSGLNGLKDSDAIADSSDADFTFEEDFLPESLTDLLTPAERNRRMSRTDEDNGTSIRPSMIVPGTPGDSVGSPPIGSPGSWGPLLNRQRRDEETTQVSGLGHVGSPLRNSYLHSDSNPIIRGLSRGSGDSSPFTNSPGRGIGGGISALTQSLKHSKINDTDIPTPSKSINITGKAVERGISSPRLVNGKVHPIDEEPECQFNLEVEEDGPARQTGGFNSLSNSTGQQVPNLGLLSG